MHFFFKNEINFDVTCLIPFHRVPRPRLSFQEFFTLHHTYAPRKAIDLFAPLPARWFARTGFWLIRPSWIRELRYPPLYLFECVTLFFLFPNAQIRWTGSKCASITFKTAANEIALTRTSAGEQNGKGAPIGNRHSIISTFIHLQQQQKIARRGIIKTDNKTKKSRLFDHEREIRKKTTSKSMNKWLRIYTQSVKHLQEGGVNFKRNSRTIWKRNKKNKKKGRSESAFMSRWWPVFHHSAIESFDQTTRNKK